MGASVPPVSTWSCVTAAFQSASLACRALAAEVLLVAEEIVAALTLIAQGLAAHEAATLPSQRRTSCKVAGLAVADAVSVLNHSRQSFTETQRPFLLYLSVLFVPTPCTTCQKLFTYLVSRATPHSQRGQINGRKTSYDRDR